MQFSKIYSTMDENQEPSDLTNLFSSVVPYSGIATDSPSYYFSSHALAARRSCFLYSLQPF